MGQIVIVNAIVISGEKTRFRFDLLYTEIEVIDNTRYKNPLRSSSISSLRTSTVHRCLDKARDCGRTILPLCSRALRFATRTGSPALVWRSSIRTAIRVIGGSRNIGSNSNRTIEHRAVFDLLRLFRNDSFNSIKDSIERQSRMFTIAKDAKVRYEFSRAPSDVVPWRIC